MSERRTFGDLRKYKGGQELERWVFEQQKKAARPIAPTPPGEHVGRIPGTEAISRKKKRGN